MRRLLGTTLVVMVLLVGCETPGTTAVQVRAANDLSCARDDVDVQSEGADRWTAFGCGRRVRYACHSEGNNPFKPYLCDPLPPGP